MAAGLAVGFRAHMGWADAVTIAAADNSIDVVDRRRLELRPEDAPSFPYHTAREAFTEDRERIIAEGFEAARMAAIDAVAELAAELDFQSVGVVVSRGIKHMPLERILDSGRMIHAAEGAVYQEALRGAARDLGLRCVTVGFPQAEGNEFWPDVSALGKRIGPPWRKDHKLAAVAALLAIG